MVSLLDSRRIGAADRVKIIPGCRVHARSLCGEDIVSRIVTCIKLEAFAGVIVGQGPLIQNHFEVLQAGDLVGGGRAFALRR